MAMPTVDIWRIAMGQIVRTAYRSAKSRTFYIVLLIGLISTLFAALFRLLLYICDIPFLDISTIASVCAPLTDNLLAQTVAYMLAFDQLETVADFILNWLLLFFAALPVVTPLVLGGYMICVWRKAMRGDVNDLTR